MAPAVLVSRVPGTGRFSRLAVQFVQAEAKEECY
jgi:hypothetical protein